MLAALYNCFKKVIVMLNIEDIYYMCKSLSKTTGLCVRIYNGKEPLYSHSVFPLEPDPVTLHLNELLNTFHNAGVITTPLFQFYGYFDTANGYRIIIGPSSILTEDKKELDNLFFLLNIPNEKREEYIYNLSCLSSITASRAAWTVSFLSTAINQKPLYIEDVQINISDNALKNIAAFNSEETLKHLEYQFDTKEIHNSYQYEKFIMFCIKNGQVDKLREVFNAAPKVKPGKLAANALRQNRNLGICAATVSARAAIAGGLSKEISFYLSDLYIQKFELLDNSVTILKVLDDMMLDFASRVKAIKYSCNHSSPLFEQCSNYIVQNIFTKITVHDMADALGFSRTYLCNQFKKQTGITLSQYILNLKIIEAQRLLQFTEKSIIDIAMHLNFSSQSHFQLSFKKITGETPMHFRLKSKNELL